MTTHELFKVVETVKSPGLGGAAIISENLLSPEDLSAKFPRARGQGGLILSVYELETGTYDSDLHEERIASADDSVELQDDPRNFDDEVDPSQLPEGYQVGEGYAAWQERTSPPYAPVRYIRT